MKVKAILDPQFIPMALLCREMREATEKDGQDIVIGIERNKGYISAYRTRVYPDGVGKDELNFEVIERMVKMCIRDRSSGASSGRCSACLPFAPAGALPR